MIENILLWVEKHIKRWVQPVRPVLISGLLTDIARSRSDLILENALLRQQLIVLDRQIKRPQLTKRERLLFVLLARCTKFWKQSILIVQPETLLRWHRELFRWHWRRKSQGKPKTSPETITLIRKIAEENPLWGAERIRGELLKLGIEVSKRSIQKYLPKQQRTSYSTQTWSTFIKNQASGIWACDFTVATDWLFRQWYIFIVMELKTRKIIHARVTKYPTDDWTAQQLREATSWGRGPKYLIRDRDSKYATHFSAVAGSIKEIKTPYRTPQANGVCERFMGSLRRECLDHILIQHDKHLQQVVNEYILYFNEERPHQGIDQRIPDHYDLPRSKPTGRIRSKEILGGLHHSYFRAAN
jgi:transposase InsO family protein